MTTEADVIVVGAGPAGSTAAYELARQGAKVVVLEEHDRIGDPCHCAGLVSPRTLELGGVRQKEAALHEYTRARVWGPLGSVAWLRSPRVQAVAIDRARFDYEMAQRAEQAGADLWLNVRAESVERTPGGLRITATNGRGPEYLQAPIVIGADGVHSKVARWFGRGLDGTLLPAMKADVQFTGSGTEDIELFVGQQIAPGWFGWVIPLDGGLARIGLGGTSRDLLNRFDAFTRLLRERFGQFEIVGRRGWMIPIKPARQIAFDNGMLVGDAAFQTKPSSGGGIYMAMRAASLAAQTALDALACGDFTSRSMRRYEQQWFAEEGEELRYNYWLRTIYNRMSDAEIDRLVALCDKTWARAIIGRLGDIDFTSRLFRPIHLALESAAPRLLQRLSERLAGQPARSFIEDLDQLKLELASLSEGEPR